MFIYNYTNEVFVPNQERFRSHCIFFSSMLKWGVC